MFSNNSNDIKYNRVGVVMKCKVIYMDKYKEEKKKDLVYRFKKFIKKVWNIINIG